MILIATIECGISVDLITLQAIIQLMFLVYNPTITLLTPPSLPTYYDIRTGNFSTPDLCLIPTHLYTLAHAKLKDIGSDHYPETGDL